MLADFIFVYLSLCILPVLLPDKHWTRYYACYVSYILIASLFAFFYIPFHLLPAQCNRWWRAIGFAIASRALGVYVDCRGLENGKYENGVMVMNHQSMIDSLICLFFGLNYSKCVGVCRKEVFYVWPFGLALSLHDCIFIDRKNGQTAFQSMLKGADLHMSKNKDAKVFIFPEGTRNEIGKEFLPFKSGCFRLAIEKQVPIIPVVISPYYFLKNKQFFSKGKIIISVLDPISTKGMTAEDVDALSEMTKNKMADEFKILTRDVKVYEDFLEKSYSLRYS